MNYKEIYVCNKENCIYNMKCEFTKEKLEEIKETDRPICLGGEDITLKDLIRKEK